MRVLVNWSDRPLSINVQGFTPHVVPAGHAHPFDRQLGIARIREAHYEALLALDPSDPRRAALAMAKVYTEEEFAAQSVLTPA